MAASFSFSVGVVPSVPAWLVEEGANDESAAGEKGSDICFTHVYIVC